jgi:hypothetical protein
VEVILTKVSSETKSLVVSKHETVEGILLGRENGLLTIAAAERIPVYLVYSSVVSFYN